MILRLYKLHRLCAGLYLLCGLTGFHLQAVADSESENTARQLEEIVGELNALDQWFTEAEEQRAALMVELQSQDHDIAELNQQIQLLHKQIKDTQTALDELNAEQTGLVTKKQQQAVYIAQHISAAYRLSGQDFLKQLLNQESPDTLDRLARYHRYMSLSRLDVFKEFQHTLEQLAATNKALNEQQSTQRRQRADLQAEQSNLSNGRDERAKLIAELEAEKAVKTESYKRLQQDRKRLATLLEELRRRATELDGTAFANARGKLPMPVAGPVRHAFGARRAEGRLRWHGIDIAASHGTPVTAVFRGRVVFSDWLRGFGFLIILDHGSGYMTLYGHADALFKRVGDWVESGETIANAGNSGGNQDSGLYFEIRHNGKPKDPITWVKRASA